MSRMFVFLLYLFLCFHSHIAICQDDASVDQLDSPALAAEQNESNESDALEGESPLELEESEEVQKKVESEQTQKTPQDGLPVQEEVESEQIQENSQDGLPAQEEVSVSEEAGVQETQEVVNEDQVDALEQDDMQIQEQEDMQTQDSVSDEEISEEQAALELPEKESLEQEVPVEEPEEEMIGIDTVDINEPEGNWLFKRIWWEKSKELFGKIRDRVDNIIESRMHFFSERVKLDRDVLDPFYIEVGLDQGALRERLSHLMEILQAEREKDGLFNTDEMDTYNLLVEEKGTLDKLNQSVMGVQQFDSSLDEALNKLMEQINLARSYEREAWHLLNEIAEELNDKKAREHYYVIAALWRNVKEIARYIEGPFAQHFIQLASLSIKNVQTISEAVDVLEERGIEVKKRIEPHKEVEHIEEDEHYDEVVVQDTGWFDWLWQKITGWFSWS